jgi:hypothetical protein
VTTGLFIRNATGRSRCGEADRLAAENSDFLVTTEDWAQAASEAAASAIANSRLTFATESCRTTACRTASAEGAFKEIRPVPARLD